MHFDFEDSETGSGSSGGESYVGDDDEEADGGHGLDDGVRRGGVRAEVKGEVMVSTGSARAGKKRAFIEEESEFVDFTGDDQVWRAKEVRTRPVKRLRRSAV